MNDKTDYFPLRIPRDLKDFFDEYVDRCEPLGMKNGNDLMRFTLITKANELKVEMGSTTESKARPTS